MCSKLRSPAAAASWIAACSSIFAHPIRSTALPSIGIPKSHSMQVISQLPTISIPSTAGYTSSLLGYSIFPQLQGILQANMLQRVLGFVSTALGFTKFGAGLTAGVGRDVYILLSILSTS
ncbi:hypothetical protein ACMD2_23999 [Ananas comosus]|uniref:Uncharacterized protein n=1 Tax=Ananas comosus TaxID=4615 RepID=A0A199UZL1_ANACO|nr:hypothetical protein ACMD2_23999 [Ananas comosus]